MIFIIKGFRTIVFIFIVLADMSSGLLQVFVKLVTFNKGCSSKFREGSRVQQTPEEGRRHIGPNIVEITMKMKMRVRKPLIIKSKCKFA